MYFDEIKGWRDGVSIRIDDWPKDNFIRWFDGNGKWIWRDGTIYNFEERDIQRNDWEPYVEPKKPKTITLYRYLYCEKYFYAQSFWTSKTFDEYFEVGTRNKILIKTETKEVTLDE